jgi:hypothetical protein
LKIFISYSRRDAGDFAEHLMHYLEDFDHGVFTDINNLLLGDVWDNIIKSNISNCDIFVVIVTPAALESEYVEREVLQAQSENKKIIPCFFAYSEKIEIKWNLTQYQGIEFSDKYDLARKLYSKIANKKYIDSGKPHFELQNWGSPLSQTRNKSDKNYKDKENFENLRIFISYSHKDHKWLERIKVHLKPLVRNLDIVMWDDSKIKGGIKWKEEIKDAIDKSKIAILLISADFMASDFIYSNELPPLLANAQNRGTIILPIILSHSLFSEDKNLNQYQAANEPSKPLNQLTRSRQEKVLSDIALMIKSYLMDNNV